MGYEMLFASAGHVCHRTLEQIGAAARSGARPDGHQTTLHCASRRRSFLRLRTENHFCSSGVRAAVESRRARLLPLAELRALSVDVSGGDREVAAGAMAGM